MSIESHQADLLTIYNMKDIAARDAAIRVIRRMQDNEESPNLSGLERTPEYLGWIQKNFYPETSNER